MSPIIEFYLRMFGLDTIGVGLSIAAYSMSYSISCLIISNFKACCDMRILIFVGYLLNSGALIMAGPLCFD